MKRKEFLKDIEGLSVDELKQKAREISEELMKLRFRQASGQLDEGHLFGLLRKRRARVNTLITAKLAKV